MAYAIQHSGNACSGLCNDASWDGRNGDCGHEGCWQCFETKTGMKAVGNTDDMEATRKVLGMAVKPLDPTSLGISEPPKTKREMREQERAMRAAKADAERLRNAINARSVLAAAPKQRPEDHQTTMVTRKVMEDLTEAAGLTMDWNDGDPIITDPNNRWSPRRDDAQERARADMRIAELQSQVESERRRRIASDADIAAAEKLLGGGPALATMPKVRVTDGL